MRKITAALLIAASSLAVTSPAFADRGHGHGNGGAIAGALLGGAVIGAVIGANSGRGPVVVDSGPRYYAPPPPAGCFDSYSGQYVPCYAPPPPPRYRYAPPPPRYYGPPPPRYYYRGW